MSNGGSALMGTGIGRGDNRALEARHDVVCYTTAPLAAPLELIELATRDADNLAGELIAGAATLRFSVAYLRDFGQ